MHWRKEERVMKWLLILLLLKANLALAIVGGQPVETLDDARIRQAVSERVIGLYFKDRDGKESFCTGFATDSRTVVTAAHCFLQRPGGFKVALFQGEAYRHSAPRIEIHSNVVEINRKAYALNAQLGDRALIHL